MFKFQVEYFTKLFLRKISKCSQICYELWFYILQTYAWENLLNTIIELCGGLKKGLHNMLNSLVIWILQNMLTLHWQVNIITMNGHMKFCILVLGTWISKNNLALLSRCIIRVLRHQSMCLLLVLSSITTSLIKCKYNIFLKFEKQFLVHDVMDVLGLVSLEEILSIPTIWLRL